MMRWVALLSSTVSHFSLFSVWRGDHERGQALARRLAAGSDPAMAGAAKRLLAE